VRSSGDGPPQFGGVWHDVALPRRGTLARGRPRRPTPRSSSTWRREEGRHRGRRHRLHHHGSRHTQFTVVGLAKFAAPTAPTVPRGRCSTSADRAGVRHRPATADRLRRRRRRRLAVDRVRARRRHRAAIGRDDIEVLTGTEITEESPEPAGGPHFFTLFLTIFALIALFVGSFIIYNVFSISAAQRERENALLRAIGASRAQVTRVLFIEALVVGIGGSCSASWAASVWQRPSSAPQRCGVRAGRDRRWCSTWVRSSPPSSSARSSRSSAHRTGHSFRSCAAARCDARRRRRPCRRQPLKRKVIGGVHSSSLVAAVVLGITGSAVARPGVAGCSPRSSCSGPSRRTRVEGSSPSRSPFIRGVTGEIAGRNAATNPKRTALTAGALAIGLALLIGVSTLGSSVKTSIRESIGEQFTGDFAVSTPDSQGFGGLPAGAHRRAERTARGRGGRRHRGQPRAVVEDGSRSARPCSPSTPSAPPPVRPPVHRGRLAGSTATAS
jgi:hypothetical protein